MLGYEFQPDEEKRLRGTLNQPGQFNPGVSEAIKVLSLKLPQVLGGRPMAPDDLLRPGVGGAGGGLGAVSQSVLNATGAGPGPSSLPSETAGAALGAAGLPSPAQQPFSMMRPGGSETSALNATVNSALQGQPPKPHIHDMPDPNLTSSPPQGASGPGIPNPTATSAGSSSLHDILEFLLQRPPDGGRRV